MTENHDTITNDLRAEIVLLSTYLSGLQILPSESHPKDPAWPLFADLSSVLTIGNSRSRQAKNVNAVMGTASSTSVDFLVCVENCRQNPDLVTAEKAKLTQQAALINDQVAPTSDDTII